MLSIKLTAFHYGSVRMSKKNTKTQTSCKEASSTAIQKASLLLALWVMENGVTSQPLTQTDKSPK